MSWITIRRSLIDAMPRPVHDWLRELWRRTPRRNTRVSRAPRIVMWFRREVLRLPPVLQHFEIHLTDHCNLNCKGCNHFSSLCRPAFADLGEFETDMRAMANLFPEARHIRLLGGEPLLHPEVSAFIRLSHEIFPNAEIRVFTNGTLVTRMPEEFWDSLSETGVGLLCDLYPIDLPKAEIEALGTQHGVSIVWTERRELFHKSPIDPAGGYDPDDSFARCHGWMNCPMIRNGRLYPCSYTAFADVLREYFSIEGLTLSDADSVELATAEDAEEVMRFLTRSVPWCGNCDPRSRSFYTWERSSREAGEWIKEPDAV